MTQTIPYWHVDAFSAKPFSGNQAAVMILDEWLPDDQLVAIGAENLFAETAFVVRDQTGAADWELRWCTPTYEIALCGHATMASGHVLLGRDGGDSVTFRTRKSGILEVRKDGDTYEVGLPAIPTTAGAYPEAEALLGAAPVSTYRSGAEHIGYAVFEFENEAAIRALNPDVRGLEKLGTDQFICTAPGDDTDIVSRVFVPGGGVDEDSVTGSAHSVLTPYWAEKLGRNRMSAYQASERGGCLALRLDRRPDGDRAWLGGPCVTVVEGRFYL